MSYLLGVPVDLDDGDVLVVEVDSAEVSPGLVLASPDPEKAVDRARVSLEEALTKLKPSKQKIAGVLRDLSPDEAEVEFGLKIGGETGLIVAKGTAEVNFVVRLTWKSSHSS
jgi:hypothetical protein